jgi:hypothetical protein
MYAGKTLFAQLHTLLDLRGAIPSYIHFLRFYRFSPLRRPRKCRCNKPLQS